MLVLTRHTDEAVLIGEGPDMVTVTVVRINGDGSVRLGFTGPDGVRIDRIEVRERIERIERDRRLMGDANGQGRDQG